MIRPLRHVVRSVLAAAAALSAVVALAAALLLTVQLAPADARPDHPAQPADVHTSLTVNALVAIALSQMSTADGHPAGYYQHLFPSGAIVTVSLGRDREEIKAGCDPATQGYITDILATPTTLRLRRCTRPYFPTSTRPPRRYPPAQERQVMLRILTSLGDRIAAAAHVRPTDTGSLMTVTIDREPPRGYSPGAHVDFNPATQPPTGTHSIHQIQLNGPSDNAPLTATLTFF